VVAEVAGPRLPELHQPHDEDDQPDRDDERHPSRQPQERRGRALLLVAPGGRTDDLGGGEEREPRVDDGPHHHGRPEQPARQGRVRWGDGLPQPPHGVAREAEREDRQQEAAERLRRHAAHRALLGGVAGEVAAGEARGEDPEDGVERPLGEEPRSSGPVDDAFPACGGPPCSAHQGVT
jgi:hypothetical protein